MSESYSSVVYADDCDSLYSESFLDRSHKNSADCGILAFYMLRFLIGRLMYNKTRFLKNLKFRALVKWRYVVNVGEEYDSNEVIVQRFLSVVSKYFKSIIKKRLMKWVEFTRFSVLSSKFVRMKVKRDEAHNEQVKQIKRIIAQVQMKKLENENSLSSERKHKESQEKSSKLKTGSDSKKSIESLKKLTQENDDLKNTLEALSKNISILLQEMGGVLDFEDQENGLEESGFRTSRRKKLSCLRA